MLKYKKKKINKFLSGFLVVIIEFGLLIAATAAFVSAFHYADIKHVEKSASTGSEVSQVSSAAAPSSQSLSSTAESQAQEPNINDWQLTLVNYDNKMPDNFQHVIVHEYNVDIDSRIVEPYRKMHDAAKKDGISLWISSGYRSPEKQQVLFEQEIQNYTKTGLEYVDAVAKAERSVARAGYSEHNTGLAIDLNGVLEDFGGTPASNWLVKHAAEYGFVLRYPVDKQDITKIKYEAWHYRYVGVEHAEKMKELNMCLEEYVDYLKENQSDSN